MTGVLNGPLVRVGERRHVSVLFSDMVGYTSIVEELGEELSLDFTQMIYARLTAAIEAHGGAVRSFAGDSVMAVFGIPETLEDSALRACRAALAIQKQFAGDADKFERQFGVRPRMRVGVSSGLAVMAPVQGVDSEMTAVGNTVNLASRIQSLAAEGGCLMCDATRRLVRWRVNAEFDAEHQIKGLAKPEKLWHLNAVLEGATRFDASVAQGLKEYVGRGDALAAMTTAFDSSVQTVAAVDIVAEPGLGKTRLVHEFLHRISHDDVTILIGQCAADAQQVPFSPFLEVLRVAYRVRSTDTATRVAEKLSYGLQEAKLYTSQNLGLLLNLLGIDAVDGSLDGLDGVLIGLRSRDLMTSLLRARCKRGRVVLRIEDIHWIDGASEGVLETLIADKGLSNLLIVHTRRPEYQPSWHAAARVTSLPLTPLTADDIVMLAQTRLGVETLPDALVRQVTERAGGNPLFGEEILSFLMQEGGIRIEGGVVQFDPSKGEAALPASMQSLLAARFDRLNEVDRGLLQAAAALGRRFNPEVLETVLDRAMDTHGTLERLCDQDFLYRADRSSDYAFRHVLLRDAVYTSLLSDQRAALHLASGQAIEGRSTGRHVDVAETLAFHYGLTDRYDLAFRYAALAGAKGLGIFSLAEADSYFASALGLYEADPACASDAQFLALMSDYALCCNLSLNVTKMIELADRLRPRLDQLGDSGPYVHFLHHLVACLIWNGRCFDAIAVQKDLSAMATRVGTPDAQAYALVSELALSCYHDLLTNEEFEFKRAQAEALLAQLDDAFLKNFFLANVAWNEVSRGRVVKAHAAANDLTALGHDTNDPRAVGYGMAMTALTALATDNHATALEISEQAIANSRAEFETTIASISKYGALVPLGVEGAAEELQGFLNYCDAREWYLFYATADTMMGIAMAIDGRIGEGLARIENVIARCDALGLENAADWYRLFLCEVYVEILSGNGDASLGVMLRNIRPLAGVLINGPARVKSLIEKVSANKTWDRGGHHIGRAEMILGLMYKAKKKHALARTHLAEAQRIVSPAGPSPLLSKIEDALSELQS